MYSFRSSFLLFTASALLLLCGCPKGDSGDAGKARGRWAGQDAPGKGTESDSSGEDAGTDQSAAGEAADSGSADSGDTADEDSQPCAEDDSADAAGQQDEEEAEAEEDASAAEEDEQEAPQPPPSRSSVDLEGEWLALFGREPSGVKPELWKSGKLYRISGNQRELEITPIASSVLDAPGSSGRLQNVSLQRSGPFLVVQRGTQGSTAYLLKGAGSTELAEGGSVTGKIGRNSHSGSLRKGGSGIIMEFDGGLRFEGSSSEGAWCGFLEGMQKRGYCVITLTGNNQMAGILFTDPYMSFETDLSFEIGQE